MRSSHVSQAVRAAAVIDLHVWNPFCRRLLSSLFAAYIQNNNILFFDLTRRHARRGLRKRERGGVGKAAMLLFGCSWLCLCSLSVCVFLVALMTHCSNR